MTFDFRSVPRCGKLAVTFFPGLVEPSLRHFLEEQGMPDILAFYESEEGQREFAEWKERREGSKREAKTK